MKKVFLTLVIAGVCLLILGGTVFTIAMAKAGWDFSELSNLVYEEKTFEIAADEISEISASVNTEDVSFVFSEDEKIRLTYFDKFDKKGNAVSVYAAEASDGVLTLKQTRVKRSFTDMDFGKSKKLVIAVPEGKKLALTLKVSTGHVALGAEGKSLAFTSLSLKTSTGAICLAGAITSDEDVTLETHTGAIRVGAELTATGTIRCKASTGDIKITRPVTAKKLECEASTGDIKIEASASAESVECKTDTGIVKVSASLSANAVTVRSDTGDVSLLLAGKKEDYSCVLTTDTGSVSPRSYTGGDKRVDIDVDTGDISVRFAQE